MPTVVEAKTLIEAVEEAKNLLHTDKIYYTTEEKKVDYLKEKYIKYLQFLIPRF